MKLKPFLYKITLAIVVSGSAIPLCKAQDVIIHFDDKGKVVGELPQYLLNGKTLGYYVNGAEDPVAPYKKALEAQADKALANILKLEADPEKMALLKLVYKIDDFTDLKRDLTAIKANAVQAGNKTYVPALTDILHYYSVKRFPSADPEFGFVFNQTGTDNKPCKPSDGKSIDIYLYKTDLYKKAVFDWYNGHAPARSITAADRQAWQDAAKDIIADIAQIQPLVDLSDKTIADFNKLSAAEKTHRLTGTLQAIAKLRDQAAALHATIRAAIPGFKDKVDLSDNKDWIMRWLWFQNNGLPQLNPFSFVTGDALGQEPDTSTNIDLRVRIQTRLDFIKNTNYKDVNKALVDGYIDDMATYRKAIANALAAYKKYQDLKKKNASLEADFAQTKVKLNDLLLFVSDPKAGIYWMRHHDGSDAATIMDVDMAKEYLESDKVVILTHNLAKDQKATVQLSYADIKTDRSQIGDLVDNALQQLSGYNIKYAPGGGTHPDAAINAASGDLLLQTKLLEGDLKTLKAISGALTYLIAQQNPETTLKENPSDSATYHSEKKQTPQVTGAKQATYTVSIDKTTPAPNAAAAAPATPAPPAGSTVTTVTVTTPPASGSATASSSTAKAAAAKDPATPVDTFRYRVDKRYRIFPMAGIAYTLTPFKDIASSSDGNSAGKVTQEQQSHFMIGLKVFFNKTDIRNNKFFLGDDAYGHSLVLTRLHFDAGVDLASPLNNIYTGAGIDLWPGVSVNGGTVFNKYNYNQYANGQNTISKSLYRTGFYLGISTDVSVVADLLKLLNLSK